MSRNAYRKIIAAGGILALLIGFGCKTRNANLGETSGRRGLINLSAELLAQAADCFKIDEDTCIDKAPVESPEKTILCLGAYLKLTPKIDFSQAAMTVNNIDAFREKGQSEVLGDQLVGPAVPVGAPYVGGATGLGLLLKKHFTYKLCSDGKRYSYSAQALKNGYAKSNDKGTISSIVATTRMSRKAEENKAKVDAAVDTASDSNLAMIKFALDNLICIRQLADVPCGNEYPSYVPITNVGVITLDNGPTHLFGPVKVPNRDITLLPGLDSSQKAELHAVGIESENYDDRMALIANAKKSILMSTWQIKQKDNDLAGQKLQRAIQSAARNHAQPFIIGDLSTSIGNSYFQQPDGTKGSIPGAIIWGAGINKSYTYHRKLTVIDGDTVIFGGKNYASEYMQQYKGPKDWRDTDVKIVNADVGRLAASMFANDWNNNTPPAVHMPAGPIQGDCTPTPGNSCFKFVTHDPARQTGYQAVDAVLASMLTAINNAQKTIDIENAYVIAFYPLEVALRRAAERHVKVRILTNSDKSIDVPQLANVMNLNACALAQNVENAEVYLKQARQTSTLHSKFMVIDRKIGFVGTYNLHPASRTTATEFVGVMEQVKGDLTGPVEKLAILFESDIKHLGRLLDKGYQDELKAAYDNASPAIQSSVVGILAMGYDIL
jgi:phosphatidylserine/phosphatidylglycerophosphate/cardiolipin synthase-like enzyme